MTTSPTPDTRPRRWLHATGPLGSAALLLLALAVHGGLLWIYWQPEPKLPAGDEQVYLAAAERLLTGRPADLDLLWPPLYPRFLAGLLWLGGGSLLAVQAVQTLLLVLAALLFASVARRLVGGVAPTVVGWGMVIYPPLVAFAHYLWPEVLHLALLGVGAWILAHRRCAVGWLVLLGLALGLALLAKSLLLGFLPVVLLALLPEAGRPVPAVGLRRAAVVLAVVFVVVAPAVRANWLRHGLPLPAEPVTFNLWVGLQDRGAKSFVDPIVAEAFHRYRESGPDARSRRRVLRAEIRALVAERGVPRLLAERLRVQYFRLLDPASFLTDQLPAGDMPRGYRGTHPGAAAAVLAANHLSYALLLAVGVGSMALFWSPRRGWMQLALAFLAYNLLLFLAFHVKSRYRIQLLPVLFLFAGLGAERARAWWWGGRPEVGRGRWWLAGGMLLLVAYLGFG